MVKKKRFRVGLATHQTDRHNMVRERRGRTHSIRRAARRRSSFIPARRVAGGRGTYSAGSLALVEGGGVCNACPRRRIYAAAEWNGAGAAVSLRRTRTMAEGNVAQSTCSLRRNCTLAAGNRARHAALLRRCCAVRICNIWCRRPWARKRGNTCCFTGQVGHRYRQ